MPYYEIQLLFQYGLTVSHPVFQHPTSFSNIPLSFSKINKYMAFKVIKSDSLGSGYVKLEKKIPLPLWTSGE